MSKLGEASPYLKSNKGEDMDIKELAAALNGREYCREITEEEEATAKAAGIVVAFGYSDDNVELRGAVDDEIAAYGGAEIPLNKSGLMANDCNDDCPYFDKLREAAVVLKAVWDSDGYSWIFEAPFHHETFEVMEAGEKFCRGIVFRLTDVEA